MRSMGVGRSPKTQKRRSAASADSRAAAVGVSATRWEATVGPSPTRTPASAPVSRMKTGSSPSPPPM